MYARSYTLRSILALCLIAGLVAPLGPPARAADQKIDLDGNPLNGAESSVETNVLQSYPVEVENVIFNNTNGRAFTFDWPGAGPGGFESWLTVGPDVGTKWTWTTVSQVYSITSSGTFSQDSRELPVFGAPTGGFQVAGDATYSLPGKSIQPGVVTVSGASLTSSLVTFFSPEDTIATCNSFSIPGRFEQTIGNFTGGEVTYSLNEDGCCPEADMTICGDGDCVSYLTDENNCGGCGITCEFDQTCEQGACTDICPGPTDEYCNGQCVETFTDPNNCGGCGITCASDEYCDQGSCAEICPAPNEEYCNGACVDVTTDSFNCGGCGNICAFDEFCEGGSCAEICPDPNEEYCNGQCADITTDVNNCGSCGNACAFDQYCDGGACTDICAPGSDLCGADCVDLQTDPQNCGACGNVCDANAVCDGGQCRTCRPPTPTNCNNVCTSTNTDPFNCGACGNVCDFTDCPSTGQGTCSQGQSCVCDPNPTIAGDEYGFSPVATTAPPADYSIPADLLARRIVATSAPDVPPAPTTAARDVSRRVEVRGRAARRGPRLAGEETNFARDDVRLRTRSVEESASLARSLGVVPAPVCGIPPITQQIADGESFTLCQTGAVAGREIFVTAKVMGEDGTVIGQGPCALIVPDPETTLADFAPGVTQVFLNDESGDHLLQPGETVDAKIEVLNYGAGQFLNPVATLSSAPDGFNPLDIVFLEDTSVYPNFPAVSTPADCDTAPVFEPQTNLVDFSFTVPANQEPGVGRVFNIHFQGNSGGLMDVDMPFVIGIGEACDPATDLDGETYDGVEGLLTPVSATLVPKNYPVNIAPGSFNRGSNIPLKLKLRCGTYTLGPDDFALTPQIVRLVHETQGDLPLENINADNNSNPDDPFFSCGTNRCEFGLRTGGLPVGVTVVYIRMPDSRVFIAGVTIAP